MKDIDGLMRQAQDLQQKLQDAQAKLAETTVEGVSGAGLVKVVMSGAGELKSAQVDDSLLVAGEGETVSDLIVAAHADAKRKLDAEQARTMQDAMGPLAGLAGGGGLPGFPGMKF